MNLLKILISHPSVLVDVLPSRIWLLQLHVNYRKTEVQLDEKTEFSAQSDEDAPSCSLNSGCSSTSSAVKAVDYSGNITRVCKVIFTAVLKMDLIEFELKFSAHSLPCCVDLVQDFFFFFLVSSSVRIQLVKQTSRLL